MNRCLRFVLAMTLAMIAPSAGGGLFGAGSKPAADHADIRPEVRARCQARSEELRSRRKRDRPAPRLVDINGAGREELRRLPGVTEAYAAKIIAGRPYRTKAHLLTHDVLPADVYEGLRARIVAKQDLGRPEPLPR